MRVLIKFLVFIVASIVILLPYSIAHQLGYTWLSIPLAVGYLSAIIAIWKWQPKTGADKSNKPS